MPSIKYLNKTGTQYIINKVEEKLGNYTLAEESGYSLDLSIDESTYIMTLSLKNKEGETLSEKTIDFPIESMVVDAKFADGIMTLTLQNGNTADVEISELVAGLVNSSLTIAGIDLKDDITAEELLSVLGLSGAADRIEAIEENVDNLTASIASIKDEAIEDFFAMYFNMQKTGKVYQTKLYKFASNPTSTGEKLLDNEGLVFEPSTDTVEGTDDYADIPLFQWWHCNYIRSDAGDPYVTAVKGSEGYAEEGLVDVGAMGMTFYWNVDTSNEDYDLWTISDSPNDELGLVPWCESVRADGSVAPYWCHSAFVSTVDTEDGLPRSLPYKKIEDFVSYNLMITEYQQKGAGYWGGGISRNTFQMIFNVIMGATKNSQSLYYGVAGYNFQYTAAVERENNDTYFPVTATEAANIIVGNCVSIGYMGESSNKDRRADNMHAYAHGVKVLSVEEMDDGNYAVYLDVDEGFPTAQVEVSDGTVSQIYMSSWHCYSGMTNSVIGKHNGSPVSNTSGKYPYRVQGTEYACGAFTIASDVLVVYQSDYSTNIYTALRGVSHSSTQSVIESTYKLAGTSPTDEYADSSESGISEYVGDVGVDMETGTSWTSVFGASSATGWADRFYFSRAKNGVAAYAQGGALSSAAIAGAAGVFFTGVSSLSWYFSACD